MKILLTKQLPLKNADLEYGNVYRQSVKAKMNKKYWKPLEMTSFHFVE